MRIVEYNKTLTEALKDSLIIYDEISKEDFDDEELDLFNKLDRLTLLEKDILYLYALSKNYSELARLYKVSTVFIKKLLNKIYEKLE